MRNKASEVGRGQAMEALGAPAKESRFHFQLNTNSLEGLNGLKDHFSCREWIEAGKSLGSKVVGRSRRGGQKPHQMEPWRMGLSLCP